jgi:hypothetical protein
MLEVLPGDKLLGFSFFFRLLQELKAPMAREMKAINLN